ncbi:hypothetical protein HanIR_Chr16g0820291 [Helianthus annuus]|nr:hypothetical protein HanIR_Chr16g0820291 [Helianthus annuus]
MPPECKPPPNHRRRSDHHHATGDAPTTTFNPFTPPEKTTICNLLSHSSNPSLQCCPN